MAAGVPRRRPRHLPRTRRTRTIQQVRIELYAQAKRELSAHDWVCVQQYADAKTEVIGKIMQRVGAP
jgi:GrpB-like predicted nucleotidyltransferase (UPF0157 family)